MTKAWDLISQMSDLDGLPEKISELQKFGKLSMNLIMEEHISLLF